MKLRNVTLATAILLALTGCGSSGGGGGSSTPNSEVNNQQNTQAQVEQQKAEVEALKKQLTEVQNNQKQQQDKLQSDLEAQKNALAKAQENLTASQSKLTKAEADLKTAQENEQKGNADKTTLQNQLNQANENLRLAQTEKANAEKALADRIAEENKLLTREEVFYLALNSGFNRTDANDLADDLQNNKKSAVIEEFIETHKTIALKRIARAYGLSNDEVATFAKENRNKTLEEAEIVLETKQQSTVKELTTLAQEKGLNEWEASQFAKQNANISRADAMANLETFVSERITPELKQELQNHFSAALIDLYVGHDSLLGQKDITVNINGKTYQSEFIPDLGAFTQIDLDNFAQGLSDTPITQNTFGGKELKLRVYKMPYSIVTGIYRGDVPPEGYSARQPYSDYFGGMEDSVLYTGGSYTEVLPSNITANYKGKAITGKETADFNYQIQFGSNNQGTGKGSITGLSAGNIELQEKEIEKTVAQIRYVKDGKAVTEQKDIYSIENGTAVFADGKTGYYNVTPHGKEASEVTGEVGYSGFGPVIGFGGTRGETQK